MTKIYICTWYMYAHLKGQSINDLLTLWPLNKVQGLFGTLKILSARHHRTYLIRILFIYFCLSWEQIIWYFNNHNITSFEVKVISQVLSQLKGKKSHLSFWDLRIHGILRNFMGTAYPTDSIL